MMKQHEVFELVFSGETLTDRWAQIDLTAEFTCGDTVKTVKGFYDGEGRYIVRFLPETAGEWHWKVTGAVNTEGTEICEAANGAHGLVKAVDTHFEYEDGTLFIPFGTTVYALAHQDDALVEQTLASLKAAPFSKVRMCVFPKHYDYNHNEPPYYAFEKKADGSWDVNRPCIAFWHRFETILKRIAEMDVQIDLILFHPYDRWGFSELPQQDNLIYLDYLLRRLAAWPNIWWSLANEYDLNMKKSLHDWEAIEEYVVQNDPFRHLLSNHNCMCFWDNTRKNITHASLQTKGLSEIPRWIREYKKPVVIDECCYEGNLPHFWGSISGQEMVRRFWRCYASGAYCTHGETFLSDDEILWWARGGVLKGGFLDLARSDEPVDMELIPQEMRGFFKAFSDSIHRMSEQDRTAHLGGEHAWESHCGEEAYLTYFDLQCYGEQTVNLPEDKVYKAELIDVWNMTQEVIAESISGETKLILPGRDNLALLITRIQ